MSVNYLFRRTCQSSRRTPARTMQPRHPPSSDSRRSPDLRCLSPRLPQTVDHHSPQASATRMIHLTSLKERKSLNGPPCSMQGQAGLCLRSSSMSSLWQSPCLVRTCSKICNRSLASLANSTAIQQGHSLWNISKLRMHQTKPSSLTPSASSTEDDNLTLYPT